MARWNNKLGLNLRIQELKREAVVEEAGRAFNAAGYHNTTLDDVARSLNISKGSIYNYFKDKEEILFECHRIANRLSDRALVYGEEHGGTGYETVRRVVCKLIQLLTTEFGTCGVLTEITALNDEHKAIIAADRDALFDRLNRIIRRGIEDGSIRKVNPEIALLTIMGSVNWLTKWYSSTGKLSAEEVAEEMSGILARGLAP